MKWEKLCVILCRVFKNYIWQYSYSSYHYRSQDSIVDILTRLRAGWMVWDLNPGRGKGFFSSPKCQDWFWGAPSLLLIRYWCSFLVIQQPGHEVDHSSLSVAEVKNECSYTCPHPVCLYGVGRDNCTFLTFLLW
jgi:hypothetical protein